MPEVKIFSPRWGYQKSDVTLTASMGGKSDSGSVEDWGWPGYATFTAAQIDLADEPSVTGDTAVVTFNEAPTESGAAIHCYDVLVNGTEIRRLMYGPDLALERRLRLPAEQESTLQFRPIWKVAGSKPVALLGDNGLGVWSEPVTVTPSTGAASLDISVVARTTTVPAGFIFKARGIGFGTNNTPAARDPDNKFDIRYKWTFPETGDWDKLPVTRFSRERSVMYGPEVAFTFETAGEHTITVEATDGTTTVTDTITVTVWAQDDATRGFAAADTIYVSTSGTFPGEAGSVEFTATGGDLTGLDTAFAGLSGPNKRILFRRGEVFGAMPKMAAASITHIGDYGAAEDPPELLYGPNMTTTQNAIVTVYNLKIDGDWDPEPLLLSDVSFPDGFTDGIRLQASMSFLFHNLEICHCLNAFEALEMNRGIISNCKLWDNFNYGLVRRANYIGIVGLNSYRTEDVIWGLSKGNTAGFNVNSPDHGGLRITTLGNNGVVAVQKVFSENKCQWAGDDPANSQPALRIISNGGTATGMPDVTFSECILGGGVLTFGNMSGDVENLVRCLVDKNIIYANTIQFSVMDIGRGPLVFRNNDVRLMNLPQGEIGTSPRALIYVNSGVPPVNDVENQLYEFYNNVFFDLRDERNNKLPNAPLVASSFPLFFKYGNSDGDWLASIYDNLVDANNLQTRLNASGGSNETGDVDTTTPAFASWLTGKRRTTHQHEHQHAGVTQEEWETVDGSDITVTIIGQKGKTIEAGDILTGKTSYAVGTVDSITMTVGFAGQTPYGYLTLKNITGTFQPGEVVRLAGKDVATLNTRNHGYHILEFDTGDGTEILDWWGQPGTDPYGDEVTGGTSGATGNVHMLSPSITGSWAGGDAAGYLVLVDVVGAFTVGETITATSGATATVTDFTLNGLDTNHAITAADCATFDIMDDSPALEAATAPYIALDDITGTLRADVVTAEGRSGPAKGAYEYATPPATVATSEAATIDFGDGMTLDINSTRTTWQYVDGSYGVLSTGGDVVITGDTPAVAADVNGYEVHGLMLGTDLEYVEIQTGTQGYSEQNENSSKYAITYDPTLNKAPSKTSSNLTVAAAGDEGRVIKTEIDATLNDGYFTSSILNIGILTASPTIPLADEIRPPTFGTIPQPLRLSHADFSRVRSFTRPELQSTLAECLEYISSPQLVYIEEGEGRRGLCFGADYARDIVRDYLWQGAIYMLDGNVSASDRTALLAAFMQKATDAYGKWQQGHTGIAGAGQHAADHFCLSLIAALCPSQTHLKTAAQTMHSNINGQAVFAAAEQVGGQVAFNTVVGAGSLALYNEYPLIPEYVGYPVHHVPGVVSSTPATLDLTPVARYRDNACSMAFHAAVVLGLIEGGWEMLYGDRATWDGDNDRFAHVGLLDLTRLWTAARMWPFGANRVQAEALEIWDAERATFPEGGTALPIVSQPPCIWDTPDQTEDPYFTETGSGVDWDATAITYDGSAFTGSTIALTDRQFRLSHDGVQFDAPISVGPSATSGSIAFTGARYVQERRVNAEGNGGWSPNWSLYNGTTAPERRVYTGGTIPTVAPVNHTTPIIYVFRYDEEREHPLYDAAATPMSIETQKLIAGAGIWEDGVDHFTYQWQERTNGGAWSDIAGATGRVWTRDIYSTSSNAKEIACNITADDGNGNTTTIRSNVIEMPQLPAPLFDDFTTDTSENYTPSSGDVAVSYDAATPGLDVDADASFQGISIPVSVAAGTEYLFEVDVTNNYQAGGMASQVDMILRLSPLVSDLISSNRVNDGGQSGTLSITYTPTVTEIYLCVRLRGYSEPGDFKITRAAVTPT